MSSSAAAFFETTLTLGGSSAVLTHALGWRATATPAALQVLVVPGNPGLASFYKVFLQQLHGLFGGRAHVWSVSNLGHDALGLNGGRVFCLQDQVQHKADLIREHVLAPGQPRAVIIGHSIGSWMVLQAVKQLEEEAAGDAAAAAHIRQQIPKVVLAMPFLATDWGSTRQRVLARVSAAAPVLGAVAGAVGRLPSWVQDRLLALTQPRAEDHARQCMLQLMTSASVHNNFHLARHEFRDLDGPVDWELIRRLGLERVSAICTDDDLWHPRHHYEEMQVAIPGIEEYFNEALQHAFCCSTAQSSIVAHIVHASVTSTLSPPLGAAGPVGSKQPGPDARVLLDDMRPDTDKAARAHSSQWEADAVLTARL